MRHPSCEFKNCDPTISYWMIRVSMSNEIRKLITTKYYAYLVCFRSIHLNESGARIESDDNSHFWQVSHEDEIRALDSVYDDLMMDWTGFELPFRVQTAMENFQKHPSLEGLIKLSEAMHDESLGLRIQNVFTLQCKACGHQKVFNQNDLEMGSLKITRRNSEINKGTVLNNLDKFKCSKCGEKNCCLING